MVRYVGLIALGALLGLVALEAGPAGLLVSVIAAIAAARTAPAVSRARSGGVLLASAATTVSVLLGLGVVILGGRRSRLTRGG